MIHMTKEQMRLHMIKASTLYSTGIQLQIEYELKVEQEPTAANIDTLEFIKRDNQKLYEVMKHFTKEMSINE